MYNRCIFIKLKNWRSLLKLKFLFILFFIFTQSLFADDLKVIKTINDIPKNKDVVLVFSMKFCPYCIRQEKTIIRKIEPKLKDIVYLKVIKDTAVFDQLIQTGNFGEVEFFPTTFILKKYDDNSLNVKYPFTGYQRSSSIISILNDQDIMED